jgi:hypothetical protein
VAGSKRIKAVRVSGRPIKARRHRLPSFEEAEVNSDPVLEMGLPFFRFDSQPEF